MASIFQKARTIVLSNMHSVLDRVVDMNSIGALEQYARDLQSARDSLDDQAAAFKSDAATLPGDIATLEARYKEADENINILLSDNDSSNDHLAAPLEAKLATLESQIAIKKESLESAKTEAGKFADAVSKLDLKLASVSGRIEVLRQLDTAAKGKERASKALSGVSLSEVPNTDDVETRLRRNAAVADNKLDRELSRVTGSVEDSSLEANVAARLAKRRQALAAQATAEKK